MSAFSFSYAPKASTALASINPLKSGGEGLRFAANTPMSFLKQNPEIVAEGFWKGRQALTEGIAKGALSAVGSVSGAFAEKRAQEKADTKLKEDRAHEIEVANIKSAKTPEEILYQQQRNALLTEQIDAAKQKSEKSLYDTQTSPVESGEIDFNEFSDLPNFNIRPAEVPVVVPTSTAPVKATPAASAAPSADPSAAPSAAVAPTDAQTKNRVEELKKDNERIAEVEKIKAYKSAAFRTPEYYRNITAESINKNEQYQKNLQELNSILAPASATASDTPAAPASPKVSQSDIDLPNYFSDINLPSPAPVEEKGYRLADMQLPETQQREYPKSAGEVLYNGETLQLMPVSGAEGKPLSTTPPVKPALPQAVPTQPAPDENPELTQPVTLSEDQYRYQIENKLTGRPYQSPADANMAKKLLEQKLGVKVEIDTEKGEKGTRLYHVRIVGDAPPPKTAPEGYFTESIRDADGKETYVYKPKIPAKQQIATFDNNIEKAKVLQETLTRIKEIAPGYLFAGAGGISGLTKYNPFANDARTTRSLLDTVKGIVGFDELVALKAQGGSLGALSDSELKMLTSLKGSIDPDMDEATFLKNINKMSESTAKLIAGLETDKKNVTNVEKPNNFQSVQSQKTNKKGDSFVYEGNRYVHDGTEFKLSK
jgi:hypothetical protein